ncbi:bifunctional tetrahydrofolate synthase/dihydrofolate synthase [Hydrogenovibrio sp. SC-1]|nr:bifunctional tetrahydrofolate synthase/dihydrofolate synthase [Hydrogenovibrio sp. SC-1]
MPNTLHLVDWLDWLLAMHHAEIDLGIERVQVVAQKLGLLPYPMPVITVAGTNGKGSSVAMLAAIYEAAGYQVGVYSSPHIIRFNERIRLQGRLATDVEIVEAFKTIESLRDGIKLTYFEYATLAALWLFFQSKLDLVILEVGLGGRLDAVNLLDADIALITAIGLDHEDWLGSDLNQIALEKAGIMRSGHPCICSDPEVPNSLVKYALANQVPLNQFKKDFWIEINDQAWSFLTAETNQLSSYENLPPSALLGDFQYQNAAGVVAVISSLQPSLPVTQSAIASGLQQTEHPGRLQEMLIEQQTWWLDVAHNPQAANALAHFLKTQPQPMVAVFSALADKDIQPMIRALLPYINTWYIADLLEPRSASLQHLTDSLQQAGVLAQNIVKCATIKEAVLTAKQVAPVPVLAWGSFLTVSQTLATLNNG